LGSVSALAASNGQINYSEKPISNDTLRRDSISLSLPKGDSIEVLKDSLVNVEKEKLPQELSKEKLSPKELDRQEKRRIKRLEEMTFVQRIKSYKGMQISFDIVGPANYYYGYSWLRTEAQLKVNLNNQFFPVIALGYAKCDDTTEGIQYKTAAPYLRMGIDYNLRWKNQNDNQLLLGFRYGFSSFEYDLSAPAIEDGIWGGTNEINYQNEASSAHWLELLIGIQTKIWGPILAGWDFRYMVSMNVKDNDNTKPYYVPGYGENSGPNFMFTYRIIYKLPL